MHLAELASKLVFSLEALLARLVEPITVPTSGGAEDARALASSSTAETAAALSIRALIVIFDEVGGYGFTLSYIRPTNKRRSP